MEKQPFHFPEQIRSASFQRLPPRIDDDGPLWTQLFELQTHGFADTASDPVADHSLAQGPRRRKADSWSAGRRLANAKSRE
jgi:hypothetical protein